MNGRAGVVSGASTAEVVMEARGLRKAYGAVIGLDGVDFAVLRGKIIAVVGDNGAGKSTLIKVLTGVIQADAGEVTLDGRPVRLREPEVARSLGIETVHQDLALAPNRDVVANLFLGREILNHTFVGRALQMLDQAEMRRRADDLLGSLEIDIPRSVGVPISRLSGGQRQAVAIARAVFWASKVMFMDEPTAALGVREAGAVLRLARRAADNGVGVVLISHVLPHVMELADKVVVMRHGKIVKELTEDISVERLIGLIVGSEEQASHARVATDATTGVPAT
jgi:fructose transport system ATP-binding protein